MGPEMKERPLFRLTRTSTDLQTDSDMENCGEPAAAAQAKIKIICICSVASSRSGRTDIYRNELKATGRVLFFHFDPS